MTPFAPETVLSAFLVFCRIGACLMMAPGFSSTQIPAKVRLFIALALSLAVTQLLLDEVRRKLGDGAPGTLLALIFAELATGLLIGFVARLFFMALQTITVAVTQAIGLGGIPGTVIEDQEQPPALSTLFTLTATTLMFISGLHLVLIRGLIDSYTSIPAGQGLSPRLALVEVADQLRVTFLVALRIGSPFLVYSIIVNFAIGVTNKLTPQIPVFFIATPFVMAGGLLLLLIAAHEFVEYFEAAFATWLARG